MGPLAGLHAGDVGLVDSESLPQLAMRCFPASSIGPGYRSVWHRAPNGQRFIANPMLLWVIADSSATLDGVDLGDVGAAPTQGELGDFRIPQRGMFAIGRAFFDPIPRDGAEQPQESHP